MRKTELHPKDIWFMLTTNLDAKIIIGSCILGSSLLLLAGTLEKNDLKKWFLGGSVVVAFAGKRGQRILSSTEPMMQIAQTESLEANKTWIQNALSPSAETVDATIIEAQNMEQADLSEFGTRRHAMIVAPSQTGKSTIAKALAKKLGGKVTVVDPHLLAGDWEGLDVVGGGRNFGAIEVWLQAKLDKMQSRYDQRGTGRKEFEREIYIIDEWPAIQKGCESAQPFMTTMARESLKVGMVLILLTQDFNVKALGLEGEGSVRDAFDVLFLGKAAIARAKALKNEAVLFWLSQQKRPGLLNDLPLSIPDLSLSSEALTGSPESKQLPPGEVDIESESESKPVNDLQQSSIPVNDLTTANDDDAEYTLYLAISENLKAGKSRTWIVENILRCRGRKFKGGMERLDSLLERFGK